MNYLLIDFWEVHLFEIEKTAVHVVQEQNLTKICIILSINVLCNILLSFTLVSNIHRDAEIFCNRCSDFIIFASQCVMKLFKNVTVDVMK